jgi:hypothetical protein
VNKVLSDGGNKESLIEDFKMLASSSYKGRSVNAIDKEEFLYEK